MNSSGNAAAAGTASSRKSADGLALEGEFSLSGISGLLEESRGWFAGGRQISIDLAGIRRTDSSGVVLLLEWQRRAKEAGCSLRYLNPSEQMRALLRFYQVESFL